MKSMLLLTMVFASGSRVGSDPTPVDTLERGVHDLIARWDGEDTPGGVVCVLRDGEPVLLETFGMADLEAGRPITSETPFYLASLAKPITAFCAVHAARAGELDLDDSLRKPFPELPESHGAATLRQAMHHTSGLPDIYDAVIAADLSQGVLGSNQRALDLLTRLPELNFEPGTRFVYSNSGYVLLAEAIERGTGKDLAAYAHRNLFEPFGMEHARYLGEEGPGDVARSYVGGPGGWEALEVRTGLRGPGGLFASMEDLIHFEQGFHDVLDEDMRSALLSAPGVSHPRLGGYGAGWMLQRHHGLRVERHMGGGFGFGSDLLRFPDQGVTVITLSNTSDMSADGLSEAVAALVLADEMRASAVVAPEAVELAPEDARRFGRFWRSSQTGIVWVLTPRESGIVMATLGDLKLGLVPVSPTRLESPDAQGSFAVELEGEALTALHNGEVLSRLERLPAAAANRPATSDHAGEYASEALEVTIRLASLPGGGLRLEQKDPLLELPAFVPLSRDLFVCDRGAQIDFHRSDDGGVTGLTIYANRAWGLRFERID